VASDHVWREGALLGTWVRGRTSVRVRVPQRIGVRTPTSGRSSWRLSEAPAVDGLPGGSFMTQREALVDRVGGHWGTDACRWL
jgi:hypothetical protein